MEQEKKQRRYRRLFLGFFAVMLIFTIASRVWDSVSIAQVNPVHCKRGSITTILSGTGVIEAKSVAFVEIVPNLRIEGIQSSAGKRVMEGDVLFTYQKASLEEKRNALSAELEKLELELQQEVISAEVYPDVTEEELAVQELATAKQEADLGRQKLADAQSQYTENKEKLAEDYKERSRTTKEQAEEQAKESYRQSKKDYQTALLDRESAIRDANRAISDIEKKLEKLDTKEITAEGGENPPQLHSDDSEQRETLERELERKRQDLELVYERWDLAVDKAESAMYEKEDIYDNADSQYNTSQRALKEAYDASVKQEEALLKAEEEKVRLLDQSIQKAGKDLEIARKRDAHASLTREQSARLSSLRQRSKQIDIDQKRTALAKTEALLQAEGIVMSKQEGFIVNTELSPGKTTTGEEQYQISTGDLQLQGTFLKDEETPLQAGDSLSISLGTASGKIEASIESVNLMGEEKGTFLVNIPPGDVEIGAIASYQCKKISDIYQTIIPITALHQDIQGYYCLEIQERKTILGQEFIAVRVDVNLIASGDKDAAVEGPLTEETRIIGESNKIISEGSRVRVVAKAAN